MSDENQHAHPSETAALCREVAGLIDTWVKVAVKPGWFADHFAAEHAAFDGVQRLFDHIKALPLPKSSTSNGGTVRE